MKQGLVGVWLLFGVGCVDGAGPVSGLGGSCNPTELGGCVKFDGTDAFADLYGYCADTSTAANDPLCEEPMHELGVTVDQVAELSWEEHPCVEQVFEDAEALSEQSMRRVMDSLRICLSQDSDESDSYERPPGFNETLIPDIEMDESSWGDTEEGGPSLTLSADLKLESGR